MLASMAGKPVFVLSGSFSSQLSRRTNVTADGHPLWSARFTQTHPEDVYKTHLDFLRAGADVITTNTYQASVPGFVKHLGLTPEEGFVLIQSAVALAKRARDTYLKEVCSYEVPNSSPLVGGSVGPYGAFLHDGSEYSGSYADKTPEHVMKEWHAPRIDALVKAGVDLLAIETIPCQKEAEVLVQLLKEYPNTKAWLSLSCKDETSLANGDNFKTAANKCYDMNPEQLLAVGMNCCSPTIVEKLLKSVNEDRSVPIPLVSYPNSGEKYVSGVGWTDKDKCIGLCNYVPRWLGTSVRFVGGCCRTYPEDIADIRKAVDVCLEKKTLCSERC